MPKIVLGDCDARAEAALAEASDRLDSGRGNAGEAHCGDVKSLEQILAYSRQLRRSGVSRAGWSFQARFLLVRLSLWVRARKLSRFTKQY